MCVVIIGGDPLEYFCRNCYQLRLSPKGLPDKCGNCGSENLVVGKCGTLDKDALLRQYKGDNI